MIAQDLYQDFNSNLGLGNCFSEGATTGVVFMQTTAPNVHEGSGALGMYSCCGNPGEPAMYISPELPDGSHTVSFWIKSSSFGCGPTFSVGRCSDAAGTGYETTGSVSGWPNPAVWIQVSFTVVTNSAKKRVVLCEPAGGGCTVFVDELLITNAGDPTGCEEFSLPAQLIDFKALNQERQVELFWQTSAENQLSGFQVERSADGLSFHALGLVAAKGGKNIRADYRFSDVTPLAGRSFYRLRELDDDGKFHFSKMLEIVRAAQENTLSVFPSPTAANLTLNWQSTVEGQISFHILHPDGRVAIAITKAISKGENKFDLEVQHLPSGTYLLWAKCEQFVHTQRFVKQ